MSQKYYVLKNDPEDIHKLHLSSSLLFDFWDEQTVLGYSFQSKFVITKRLMVDAYYYSGFKNRDENDSDPDFTYNNVIPYGWEVTGQFGFSSNLRRQDLKIRLGEFNGFIESAIIEGKRIRDWTIRGGYMSHNSKADDDITRNVTMNAFVIGIGHVKWSNLKVNIDGYGKKHGSMMVSYYFDMIFATSITTNDSIKRPISSKTGWRFGIEVNTSISSRFSMYLKASLENRPGISKGEYLGKSIGPDMVLVTGISLQLL